MKRIPISAECKAFTTYENLHELYTQFQFRLLANETVPEELRLQLYHRAEAEKKNVTFENMTTMKEIQTLIRIYEAFRNELIDLKILDWEKKVYTIIDEGEDL